MLGGVTAEKIVLLQKIFILERAVKKILAIGGCITAGREVFRFERYI